MKLNLLRKIQLLTLIVIISSVPILIYVDSAFATEDEEPLCFEGQIIVDGICEPGPSQKIIVHGDRGSCLIATASYGSELAPQVQMLREVRDNILLNTESGKIFMDGFNTIYYSFSPQIAQLENDNEIFRESVKLFITPMITTLSLMTLAEEGSESHVLFYGISSIGLIVGMYIVAPSFIVWKIKNR